MAVPNVWLYRFCRIARRQLVENRYTIVRE